HWTTRRLEHRGNALNTSSEVMLAQSGDGSLDVDLFLDADPAPAPAVLLAERDILRSCQLPRPHGKDKQTLVGTKTKARIECFAREHDLVFETGENRAVAHCPALHDF